MKINIEPWTPYVDCRGRERINPASIALHGKRIGEIWVGFGGFGIFEGGAWFLPELVVWWWRRPRVCFIVPLFVGMKALLVNIGRNSQWKVL